MSGWTLGMDAVVLDATLDSGFLTVSLDAESERLRTDLRLGPGQAQWDLDLQHRGNLDLAWLLEAEASRTLSQLPAAIDVRLRGSGTSLGPMLASARGQVELALGAGRLHKSAAALPLGDVLLTLVSGLNPLGQRRQFDDIQCAVLQFEIADGIATSTRGLAVQTKAINALGSGAIDLENQEIELHVKTTPRKGLGINLLGIADRFVYLTGTLSEPRVSFDPKGLLVRGGAAWATAGISLLVEELAQRLTAASNPCDTVLKQGAAGRR